jgi:hypothetical protein
MVLPRQTLFMPSHIYIYSKFGWINFLLNDKGSWSSSWGVLSEPC